MTVTLCTGQVTEQTFDRQDKAYRQGSRYDSFPLWPYALFKGSITIKGIVEDRKAWKTIMTIVKERIRSGETVDMTEEWDTEGRIITTVVSKPTASTGPDPLSPAPDGARSTP